MTTAEIVALATALPPIIAAVTTLILALHGKGPAARFIKKGGK